MGRHVTLENTNHSLVWADSDQKHMAQRGTIPEQVEKQITLFKEGIPFSNLHSACTVNNGIREITSSEQSHMVSQFEKARETGRVMKLVPASGAASRMFKSLLACLEQYQNGNQDNPLRSLSQSDQQAVEQFIQGLTQFAFTDELAAKMREEGHDLVHTQETGNPLAAITFLLTSKGLHYAALPKGLLTFHKYPDHVRTPIEEQLVEAAAYTLDGQHRARIHFTVSPEHEPRIKTFLKEALPAYEQEGVAFELSFSHQKPSTDTIAVDMENNPFRDQEGQLVFRPGGHGALLENLHDLQGDIIFIKNIDNVVPDHLKPEHNIWKKVLGGCLLSLQEKVFHYLHQFTNGEPSISTINEIMIFAKQDLFIHLPSDMNKWNQAGQIQYLQEKLNRPMRVCGMVRNIGEPGGGPFWVEAQDGTLSPQIVESSQVNPDSKEQQERLASSTHFNPVDLVCGVRDFQGNPFDLRNFVDPMTGFISQKSSQGRELKALELPGLWNGAMAHWITVFVEVPLSTFNPVKTVLDLLRPEHQPQ
ncbi:MAG: DUF4301 family protein [Nitrospirae bacterium]|nr:DUF4301 family protein [Nitrospirota bacterium]